MKSCEVCKESAPKYRCPSCRIQYCSVLCYKTHKLGDICERETNRLTEEKEEKLFKASQNTKPEAEEGEISHSDSDDEDAVNHEDLEKLGQSSQLREMLQNEHLRHMISHIDGSNWPNEDLKQAMKIPIFTEFVDECLKVVEPSAPH